MSFSSKHYKEQDASPKQKTTDPVRYEKGKKDHTWRNFEDEEMQEKEWDTRKETRDDFNMMEEDDTM